MRAYINVGFAWQVAWTRIGLYNVWVKVSESGKFLVIDFLTNDAEQPRWYIRFNADKVDKSQHFYI